LHNLDTKSIDLLFQNNFITEKEKNKVILLSLYVC
jgi:hypothetical protein